MDAELRKQPTTDEGAYDSNDEIADDPKQAQETHSASSRPRVFKLPLSRFQSATRGVAKLYHEGSIGERKSAGGAATASDGRHRPI